MKVRFSIRGIDKVKAYLASVPRGTMRVALDAIARWLIGDSQGGLMHPEPYKYASRAKAYGYTGAKFKNGARVPAGYFSAKQFFYVAAITHGFTDRGSKRTSESSDAWTYKPTETNKGYSYRLINDTPGAYYTRDDYGQAQQPANVGWLKVSKVVAKNIAGALRAAIAAVNAHLKSKK